MTERIQWFIMARLWDLLMFLWERTASHAFRAGETAEEAFLRFAKEGLKK